MAVMTWPGSWQPDDGGVAGRQAGDDRLGRQWLVWARERRTGQDRGTGTWVPAPWTTLSLWSLSLSTPCISLLACFLFPTSSFYTICSLVHSNIFPPTHPPPSPFLHHVYHVWPAHCLSLLCFYILFYTFCTAFYTHVCVCGWTFVLLALQHVYVW